ncbi:hypothetical protein EHP00_2223 [Ecytonucleospora hepatopenaei]|uniref:Uncharacterized protein n=1 Tax=Ecytonucleospora hepatopenaei TaxID=646526 RepID=A0A1W0E499_9MICR|nr:hypothetical protein EHP00_2223 [Ecytonucleospora hepatopenaei]
MDFSQNNVTKIVRNIVTKNELTIMYKDWNENNIFKNKDTLRVKRKSFCDKYKLKHIEYTINDIKKFMKDVNDVYKNNLKKYNKKQ